MAHPNPTAGQSASELQTQIEAERAGPPFLVFRTADGIQHLLTLGPESERIAIGRGEQVGVDLEGDPEISRLHAELIRIGGAWVIDDDGLSTNGSFVNGERITRRRLADKDLIAVGGTGILFREPAAAGPPATVAAEGTELTRSLTGTQREVLIALCRPFRDGSSFATPATNKGIAEEVSLSVDAVKGHLRVLFDRFELGDLPQNEKRARLAERALRTGAVRPRDLD